MKTIILSCITTLFISAASAQTPISLDKDDFAGPGDEYTTVNVNPIFAFDGTATGANFVWNFSLLETQSEGVANFVDVSDTDPLYFFLWLVSDLAQQTATDIVNAFITVEDIYNFYKIDNSEYSLTGFAGTISGIPLPISYSDPEIIYTLPAEYNDVSSSEVGFDISVPGFGGWSENRIRTNENDGWGTLILPNDATNYEVLRTKSTIEISDVFTYDIFEIPFSYTATEYRWMGKLSGMPLLQVNAQTILGAEAVTQIVYKTGDYVGINETSAIAEDFSVTPNPVADNAQIQFNSATSNNYNLMVTDINGKIVVEKNIAALTGENSIAADLNTLAAGTYIISLNSNGKIVATQKIIKK